MAERTLAPRRPAMGAVIAIAIVFLVLLATVGTSIYTDLLWFREVDFSGVFTTRLRTQLLLFVLGAVLLSVFVCGNVVAAYRLRPALLPPSLEQRSLDRYRAIIAPRLLTALIALGTLIGVIGGAVTSGRWQTWLAWRNAVPFGVEDPQFGRDVSYYAFTYPFQRFVLGMLFAAVLLSIVASGAVHYLYGGIRLQTRTDRISAATRAHLSVLFGCIALLKAFAYYLDMYGQNFSSRGVVTGASYADVNAKLPALRILIVISLICAALFFATVWRRGWALPATAFGLLLFSALVIGGAFPAIVQQVRVRPNERAREAPYIERSIAATRSAYAIDHVKTTPYAAARPPSQADVRADKVNVPNIRLLDPNHLQPTFEQRQQIRGYYGFPQTLDIDRYTVNGKTESYVVAARELDQAGLAENQRNWVNTRLTFTHGYGFVAAPADRVTANGEPDFAASNFDDSTAIAIKQPRIYYGELAPSYSIVRTEQDEVDQPRESTGGSGYHYDGKGGVQLSGWLRRVAYATKFRDTNIMLSGALTSESRIIYVRDPRDRVRRVAPYLELDSDPYTAVVDGRIVWIVDGYTTVAGYPYARPVGFGEVTLDATGTRQTQRSISYIRNSVKATVDAFDGTVTLYQWDEDDPVVRTWAKAFDGTLRPRSEMSPDLVAHVRYPEDLFKVQRELLGQYHVTDPDDFYNEEDFWEVPSESENEGKQAPYYLRFAMPGQEEKFQLTTSLVARRRPNLAALVAVSSEPGDYGNFTVLDLPSDTAIPGPAQANSKFNGDPDAGSFRTLQSTAGSTLIFGNLLTLPVGDGLLFVRPVYVQGRGSPIVALTKVLVGAGEQVGFGNRLSDSFADLFSATPPSTTPPGTTPPPPTGTGDLAQAIADAQSAYAEGVAALARGDFAAYGEAQRKLKEALDRLASESGASPSPSPSP